MTSLSRLALLSALALGVGLAPSACTAPAPEPTEEKAPVAQGPEVSFRHDPNVLHIDIGGQPFADYHYADKVITRPFFANVKTPSGIQATRNHPPDPENDLTDHGNYHPGIWMSFGDISGNDYWRLKAKVKHEMFVEAAEGWPGQGDLHRPQLLLEQGRHRSDRVGGGVLHDQRRAGRLLPSLGQHVRALRRDRGDRLRRPGGVRTRHPDPDQAGGAVRRGDHRLGRPQGRRGDLEQAGRLDRLRR